MYHFNLRALFNALVIALTLPVCFANAEEKNTIRVPSKQLLCIIDNFSKYVAAQGTELIVVILEKCPNPDISIEDISSLSFAMSPKPNKVTDNQDLQKVISLNRDEIKCIMANNSKIISNFPKKPIINVVDFLGNACR